MMMIDQNTVQTAKYLVMLWMQIHNKVSVLSGCEHASGRLSHLLIRCWEELAERAAQHLQGEEGRDTISKLTLVKLLIKFIISKKSGEQIQQQTNHHWLSL